MLTKYLAILAIAGALLGLAAPAQPLTPGSGSATVAPLSDVVAGSQGTWSFAYTASDTFSTGGIVEITTPVGWTSPQDAVPTSAGYVTVTSDDSGANPVASIAGRVVTITVDTLFAGNTVTLVYGDDAGGANPGAVATAQTARQDGVVFLVRSDPAGAAPAPIAISPTLDVIADVVTKVVFLTGPFTFQATSEAGPLRIQTRDQFNNPSPVSSNQQINLSSQSSDGDFSILGGGSFSSVSSIIIQAGKDTASFYYRDTTPGTPEITASGNGQSWTNAVQEQTVNPGPVKEIEISPVDPTITAGTFVSFVVRVVDALGNKTPLSQSRTFVLSSAPSGQFFNPSNHTTPISILNMSSGVDSTIVHYRNTNANDGDAHLVIILSNDAPKTPSLFVTNDVTVNPTSFSGSVSTINAPSPVVADGGAFSSITVTVLDTFANPLSGVAVDLSAASVSGGASVTDPAGPTGANGVASGAVRNTTAETVTMTATANAQALAGNALVVFQAGAVSANTSTVDASPASVVANGATTSTITVTARDAQGNPVSGVTVALSIVPPGAGAVLTQPGTLTDVNGRAQGTLHSSTTGTRTVSATVNATPVVDNAVVNFTPGPPASFVWTKPSAGIAGQFIDPISLEVLDALSNRVIGHADTVFISTTSVGAEEWAIGAGALGVLGSLPNGQWFYTFVPLDSGLVDLRAKVFKSETITLSANRGAATGTSSGIAIDHATADKVLVELGNAQSAEVNTAVAQDLVVRVVDAFDNNVDGQNVTFGTLTGGGSRDVNTGGGTPNDSVAVSNGSGLATCDLWRLGITAGPNKVTARITAGSVPTVLLTATGTPGAGNAIVLTPASSSVTVGSLTVVEVVLRDQFNNTVPDERVDILIKVPDGTLEHNPGDPNPTDSITPTARWGTTNSSGKITVRYRAPGTAGLADALDAFASTVPQTSVTDAVYTTVAGGNPTKLRIVFVGSDTARAGNTFSFRVQAVDGNNNVIPGNNATVNLAGELGGGLTFSLTDFGATVPQVTLVNGEKLVFGRGQFVGDWNIQATDQALALAAGTEEVTITDTGVVASYQVTTVSSVGAGAVFNVSVQARDQFTNPVVGANNAITLTAVAADSTPIAPPDTLLAANATLSSGVVQVPESFRRARTMRVRVRDAALKQGFSGIVTVNAGPAYRLVELRGDSTNVVAGAGVPVAARVLDPYDNGVTSETVSFAVSLGGGNVSPPAPVSNATGRVDVTFTTSILKGPNRAVGTIGNGDPAGLETVEIVVQTIAGPIHHYAVTPQKTTVEAGEVISVNVQARDVNENLVSQNNTTIINVSETANAVLGATSGTLSAGTFATTVRDTVAETFVINVQTQGTPSQNGASPSITVNPGDPFEIVKVSGDATGFAVGANRDLVVNVSDTYGNDTPGAIVLFDVVSDPGGASVTDTVGVTTDGITTTNAAGRTVATLHTSLTVGDNRVAASILAGIPPNQVDTFTVATQAGAIAYYTVVPATVQALAGNPVSFTVTAFDGQDNQVNDSSTMVVLTLATGVGGVFTQTPIQLQNGSFSTTVTDNTVEVIQIRAETQGGGALGLSPLITILPSVPAGVITVASFAPNDTITANSISTTVITTNPIRDAFLNPVGPGRLVTVSTSLGSIDSPDQDPATPGTNQQVTNASSVLSFRIRSAASPGTASVSMNSVQGSATGAASVVFAPVPVLVTPANPVPSTVTPGTSYAFKVFIQNTAQNGVTLSTLTSFKFNDGVNFFSAPLAAPKFIGPLSSDTLVFANTAVSVAMAPTSYQALVQAAGTDQYGASYAGLSLLSLLPAGGLRVAAIQIVSISPGSNLVSRGATEDVTVRVRNNSPNPAIIETIVFSFSVGSYDLSSTGTLPDTIPGDGTRDIVVPVTIQPFSALGTSTIDASVFGNVNGAPVSDNSLAPFTPLPTWTIQSAADVVYVTGSLVPSTVSRGQVQSLLVALRNDGAATVTLDTMLTTLSFTDGPRTYLAKLKAAEALPGSSTQVVEFKPVLVSAAFTPGSYNVALHLEGVENGGAFAHDINTGDAGDQIAVVTPASVAYQSGTLTPTVVNRQATAFFQVTVLNSGGAAVELDPDSTRLLFAGGVYNAALDDNLTSTIAGGGPTVLRFQSTLVSAAIGSYFPTIRIRGTENGLPFSANLVLSNSVLVQNPAVINIVSITPSQNPITADQSPGITLTMVVTNTGAAAVDLDSTRVRFIEGGVDRTNRFAIVRPTVFQGGGTVLNGGQTRSLVFAVADNTANSMVAGNYTIEGDLWVEDIGPSQIYANTNLGGKGSLLVQTPAEFTILSITPSKSPVTVSRNMPFVIRMAVRNNGQSDAQIALLADSTRLSFSLGSGWVAPVGGALAGGGNILSGGEVDTVVFNVATVGNAAGTIDIDGEVRGVELNSGRFESDNTGDSGSGSILVQSQAVLDITSVVPSRSSVTQLSGADWEILVRVQNTGQSDLNLNIPGSVTVTFQNQLAASTFQMPATLISGTDLLPGGATDSLRIVVSATGSVSTPGNKIITVALSGQEVTSGFQPIADTHASATVAFQLAPSVTYVNSSLDPDTVSTGASVGFDVGVSNIADGATVILNPAATRLRFGGGLYDVALNSSGATTIPDGPTTLAFNPASVNPAIPTGQQAVRVDLAGTQNGNPYAETLNLPAPDLVVQEAPQLSINAILTSQPTVTQNQTRDWTATMVVQNNGQADVNLNLTSPTTRLQMRAGTIDVTGQYTIQGPESLAINPGTVLPGGAVDSLTFIIKTTGSTTGQITINGTVGGTFSGGPVSGNTFNGGNGTIQVQSPGDVDILSVTTSQPKVTAGQPQDWTVKVALRNSGTAALNVNLAAPTQIQFNPSAGWPSPIAPTLQGGGTLLTGGETDTLVYTIPSTAGIAQSYVISASVQATEVNSDSTLTDATTPLNQGSILVQIPANLSLNVTTSRPSVTEGSQLNWNVLVAVTNSGQSDASIDFASPQTRVQFPDATIPFDIIEPVSLVQGGTVVPGLQTRNLVFTVDQTGTVAPPGATQVRSKVRFVELNSAHVDSSAFGVGSVTVQQIPAPLYVSATLSPSVVSSGTSVAFQLNISNLPSTRSTLRLTPGQTRLRFGGNVYNVQLDPASVDSIPGGTTATLRFLGAVVSTSISVGPQAVSVNLAGTENGNVFPTTTLNLPSTQLTIQVAPQLNITSIRVSQPTVTQSQTADWTATMVVENNGDAGVDLNLTKPTTRIQMVALGGDVTAQYLIEQPTELENTGNTILPGGATDSLKFTIQTTGVTTGPILINGFVGGTDQNPPFPFVSDETDDGGWGSVIVQAPGVLTITGVTTSQPTVTTNQTRVWTTGMRVENTGGSDVEVTDNPDSTTISFSLGTGWTWEQPANAVFVVGPVTLGANESTTIFFEVTQSGNTAGTSAIRGKVRGRQLNDGAAKSDTTDTSGAGSILVQTPANLQITQVVPSVPRVTENQTTAWTIAATVTNNGQAAALLSTAQAQTFAAFPTASPPDTVVQPTGTLSLPGSGGTTVLTFNVAPTPDFATSGVKPINVRVGGSELNSNDPVSAVSAGSIPVDLLPNPAYVLGTVTPTEVTRGSNAVFQLQVQQPAGSAVIALNPGATRFRLSDGSTEVAPRLSDLSASSIPPNASTLLVFDNALISQAFNLGSFQGTFHLEGTQNGTFYSTDLTIAPNNVTINPPGAVEVNPILTSQGRVTTGQTQDWRARMVVRNNGALPLVANPNPAITKLQFNVFPAGDKSIEYTVTSDYEFLNSNDDTLQAGTTDTLLFVVDVTGTTPGPLTLHGHFEGREVPSGTIVGDNTIDGGAANMVVETPAVLEIVSIQPSQPTVTQSQVGWRNVMTVRNTGGSAIDLDLPASQMTFLPAPGWTVAKPTALQGGGIRLDPNEADTLYYPVTATPGAASYRIDGTLPATEVNSGRLLSDNTTTSGSGTIVVQTPALLAIQQITKSREPVTNGQTTPWTIGVTVRNNGQAAATLSLVKSLSHVIFTATGDSVGGPTGNTSLPGDSTRILTFTVAPTPNFVTAGAKAFTVRIGGSENNTGSPRNATGNASITVDLLPDPVYAGSLDPRSVERGGIVGFRAQVQQGLGRATLVLDPIQTQILLTDGITPTTARLSTLSANTINAGASTLLVFENVQINTATMNGSYLPTLTLKGTENGNAFTRTISTGVDSVSVLEPADVRIVQIVVSQNQVTAGQTKPWTARMIVENNGSGAERVNTTLTRLIFTIAPNVDVTSQYSPLLTPTFLGSGTEFIGVGQIDTLLFTVGATGTTTGSLRVDGIFKGDAVQDDTFTGGSAAMLVQSPPVLRVTQIRPSQPRVTAGQRTDWQATARVENQGGAAVRLTFDGTTPSMRAEATPGYVWIRPIRLFADGDSTLTGGEVDSLIFTVDVTGPAVGVRTLHARVAGLDVNSDAPHAFDTQTQGSGSGTVVVQDSARVVIQSTVIAAPQAPTVNIGQAFNVIVRVGNQGGADLKDVSYRLVTSGGSVVGPPATMLASSIPSSLSKTDTFTVTANGVVGAETATASIVNAFDANALDSSLVEIGPHIDTTANFAKVTPAVLSISAVTPSQTTVTRQQTADWNIDVTIDNPGGAAFNLTPPTSGNIRFFRGGTQQNDYIVTAPTSFVSGTPGDWRVVNGAPRTLRYTVGTTGDVAGSITIRANLAATDINDLTPRADEDSGSVAVVDPAGLFIESTRVDSLTAPNRPLPNTVYVNNNQRFNVIVDVKNNGGGAVNVFGVRLTSSQPSVTQITPMAHPVARIGPDSVRAFVFEVQHPLTPAQNTLQINLTASIDSARSAVSGQPVTPTTPVDNVEIVHVQRHANLALDVVIASPPEATDGVVGVGQTFQLRALVNNLGVAGVDASGRVTLVLPVGFTSSGPPATTPFTPGTPIIWNIFAPSVATPAQDLTVTMSTIPRQLNVDSLAFVSQARDSVSVQVQESGFVSTDLIINSPAGAMDAFISTEQQFTVLATVVPQPSTVNIMATLQFSSGLTPLNPITQSPAGSPLTVQYRMRGPVAPSSDSFRVVFTGEDANAGNAAVSDTTTSIVVTSQARASLSLSARILAPAEALDSVVTVNSVFTIEATVQNLGVAGIDTSVAGARPRVLMTLPSGYSFEPPPAPTQAFQIGTPVTWNVRAPSAPTFGNLTMNISEIPHDENTNQPAQVAKGTETIPIQTGASSCTVDNISVNAGIGTNVVQGGAQDIRLLAIELANPSSLADAVRIETVDVAVLNQNGGLVGNPSTTITEMYAVLAGQRVDAAVLTQNPVRLSLAGAGGAAVIPSTGSDSLVVWMSLAANPALDQVAIDIRNNGSIIIRSEVTGDTVPVVDKNTQQSFAGKLRSQNVVIMSNQFSEYVHNYPNPFSPSNGPTKIAYFLEAPGDVSVSIYDLAGAMVYEKRLSAGDAGTGSGPQEVQWDGRNMQGTSVRNGIYVCQITAGSNSAKFKIAVAK